MRIKLLLILCACVLSLGGNAQASTPCLFSRVMISVGHGFNAVGNSAKHGATAIRVGWGALVKDIKVMQVSVTPNAIVIIPLEFDNNQLGFTVSTIASGTSTLTTKPAAAATKATNAVVKTISK